LVPGSIPETIDLSKLGPITQYKDALFRSIAASKDLTAQQALQLYRALFPGDEWAKDQDLDQAIKSKK
jgi:hypothetical protein